MSEIQVDRVIGSDVNQRVTIPSIQASGDVFALKFTSLSDESEKENIKKIKNADKVVQKLTGVTFNWKKNGSKDIGLIAQEVEKILPEVIEVNAEGKKTISYGNIVALLIEAIKQQNLRIAELEKKLNA